MNWTSALAIYFIMWFFCLFLVLPFHARRGGNEALVPGQAESAPTEFRPGRVALQVSLVAALLFALFYANYVNQWVGVEDINLFGGPPG